MKWSFCHCIFFFKSCCYCSARGVFTENTHFHPKGLLAVVTVFKKERILLTSEPLLAPWRFVVHSLFTYTKIIVLLQQNRWAHYALVRNIQKFFSPLFFFLALCIRLCWDWHHSSLLNKRIELWAYRCCPPQLPTPPPSKQWWVPWPDSTRPQLSALCTMWDLTAAQPLDPIPPHLCCFSLILSKQMML